MTNPSSAPFANGLAVLHANKLETLRDLVVAWVQQHPLAPLENERFLVQSNGMAQWLKLALAANDGLGICAAVSAELPARFLWRAYQMVLNDLGLPEVSPFDKNDITWRLFRRLPALLHQPDFVSLQRFLSEDDDARKRYQLAHCLADLFDQYQVYRADWLEDWTQGQDYWRNAHGQSFALPEEHRWQASLWRDLVEDIPSEQRIFSRAALHQRFLHTLDGLASPPPGLPRRIIVFGISALPKQTLDALLALSRFSQILLCVHNPCQYYWADIIEHKELLRVHSRRHREKMPPDWCEETLHLHANPLLAAWGKQGRDYIGLLNEIDDPERYQQWFQRIDVFEDYSTQEASATLLLRVQQAILDLEPLPESEARPCVRVDDSLMFHVAHSAQREVEILQDQLLSLMATQSIEPRDIIVMVPDIDRYAPHIRAVFGQIATDDPRYLPFSVNDQRERGQNPLLIALESLLHLPESRCCVSEVLDLLDVPALLKCFAIDANRLPTLIQWIQEAGIRWGLHAEQRQSLGLPAALEQNTWRFGLRRMLLGYAVGAADPWQDIEPYDEIAGLDAALLGPLIQLLDALDQTWQTLSAPMEAMAWGQCFRELLERFFVADTERDVLTLEALFAALDDWEALCQRVDLQGPLPLTVMREIWLGALDQADLSQRFFAGRINFCTLMPMRAIPFQVVCLLGMNDGDYPRESLHLSFDLMQALKSYRPGDRSRREDDRYLFLEALLSARRTFYISWIGRSLQDNSPLSPSLLVGQLRDYLAAGWQLENADDAEAGSCLLQALTVEHPLQAFSERYFQTSHHADYDPRLFTYAHEWRSAWDQTLSAPSDSQSLPPLSLQAPLNLELLAGFLRYPVKAFFNQRLKVWLDEGRPAHEDSETFVCNGLQNYGLGLELLQAAMQAAEGKAQVAFEAELARQQRSGVLPMAGFAKPAQKIYADAVWQSWQRAEPLLKLWPLPLVSPYPVQLLFSCPQGSELVLEDWLNGLRQNGQAEWALVFVSPQALLDGQQQPKYPNLIRPWLKHLAACASGLAVQTFNVGPDAEWAWAPLPVQEAQSLLNDIIQAWYDGMQAPLPLACRSAFAWLQADNDKEAAASRVYEGNGFNLAGEVERDSYLYRQFPDFQSLLACTGKAHFVECLQRLYAPLWQATPTKAQRT